MYGINYEEVEYRNTYIPMIELAQIVSEAHHEIYKLKQEVQELKEEINK